jgi:hypothetical protein
MPLRALMRVEAFRLPQTQFLLLLTGVSGVRQMEAPHSKASFVGIVPGLSEEPHMTFESRVSVERYNQQARSFPHALSPLSSHVWALPVKRFAITRHTEESGSSLLLQLPSVALSRMELTWVGTQMATRHKSMGELPTNAKVTSVLPSGMLSLRKPLVHDEPLEMSSLVWDGDGTSEVLRECVASPPDNRGRSGRSKQQPVRWSARADMDQYNQGHSRSKKLIAGRLVDTDEEVTVKVTQAPAPTMAWGEQWSFPEVTPHAPLRFL